MMRKVKRRSVAPRDRLTVEEEAALVGRAQAGDERALAKLFVHFDKFIAAQVRACRIFTCEYDDLLQEGRLGFMEAVSRHKPELARLATYASMWIRLRVRDYALANASAVKHPSTNEHRKNFFSGLPQFRVVSIETPVSETGMTLSDVIPAIDIDIDARLDEATIADAVRITMRDLDPRDRTIIEHRYLNDEPSTYAVLSKLLGITDTRIQQLQSRAFAKMRDALTITNLNERRAT